VTVSFLRDLGPNAVHVAVDVQRLFAEPTSWHVPDITEIVPNIQAIARAMPGCTLFTRFVVPMRAEDATGQWRPYYEHWSEFTGAVLPPDRLDLVEDLAALATPGTVFDKLTYSAFEAPAFVERLAALDANTILFTGVETDVCVLSTLLAAVDRGHPVIAVADAMASSSAAGHAATLDHVLPRFDRQVEIADTRAVLAALA
jgi:nicotinamidase-related amidase